MTVQCCEGRGVDSWLPVVTSAAQHSSELPDQRHSHTDATVLGTKQHTHSFWHSLLASQLRRQQRGDLLNMVKNSATT